jgi:SAM-dependent methyltransferase
MTRHERRTLIGVASRPYFKAGFYPYFFARGKLRIDPVFLAMLRTGSIPDGARILDLGCGQALIAALLIAARRQFDRGGWPAGWPEPPASFGYVGIDVDAQCVRWARRALGERVNVQAADLRGAELPDADVVVLLDVLHYLGDAEQLALLEKVAHSLRAGGKLLLRIADTAAGWRAGVTRLADHSAVLLRGRVPGKFLSRSVGDWSALLVRHGFRIEREPMSQGTPFANILLTAHR